MVLSRAADLVLTDCVIEIVIGEVWLYCETWSNSELEKLIVRIAVSQHFITLNPKDARVGLVLKTTQISVRRVRDHSPTRLHGQGGTASIGLFGYRGKHPCPFSRAAFQLLLRTQS